MRGILHKIHLWIGLVLCVPLMLLGLSGSILVVQPAVEGLFPSQPVAAAGAPHTADEILAAVRKVDALTGFRPLLYRPAADGGLATVLLTSPPRQNAGSGERVQARVDPVSLVVTPRGTSSGVMRTILLFHNSLLMREHGGRSLVGWLGVAMLVFGLSGPVLWWPKRGQRKNAFKVNRTSRGWKLMRELHGATGIWCVLVLLVVSASGVYLAFPRTMNAAAGTLLSARNLRAPPAAKVVPVEGQAALNVDQAIQLAHDAVPDSRLVSVVLPAKRDQPYRVALARTEAAADGPPISVYVDPWQKRTIEVRDPRDYSVAETALAWQHAIHTGGGFGWLWRTLVFIVGLVPALFAITGVSMWFIKRRIVARR